MPYITQDTRDLINSKIDELTEKLTITGNESTRDGILNYSITSLLVGVFKSYGPIIRYRDLNSMMGILECVKHELYRRLGSCLEDGAIVKNGDIEAYRKDTPDFCHICGARIPTIDGEGTCDACAPQDNLWGKTTPGSHL